MTRDYLERLRKYRGILEVEHAKLTEMARLSGKTVEHQSFQLTEARAYSTAKKVLEELFPELNEISETKK